MGHISGKDKSISPRNIVGGFGSSGGGFFGGGGNISTDEVAYVRLSSGVDEPLAGLNPIDGVTPTEGDLILCMSQIDPAFRAVYVASAMLWEEKVYVSNPKLIIVEEGTLNGETAWLKVESETDSWEYVKIETGGGGLPAGSSRNTMYHDGTDWVANERLQFDYSSDDYTSYLTLSNYGNIPTGFHYIILEQGDEGTNIYIKDHNGTLQLGSNIIKAPYFRLSNDYLQAHSLNPSGKQLNSVVSASGHVQTIVHDRARLGTAVVISDTTLTEVLTLATSFRGSVATAYSKTYSYKVHFKIFFDFDTKDVDGLTAGLKFQLIARSGVNTGTWEIPSEFIMKRFFLNTDPLGLQSVQDYGKIFDYNNILQQRDLASDNTEAVFFIEGEAFLNDFAYDDVEFAIKMAEYTTLGNMTVRVGSYIDYEVCNTNDV